MKHRDYQKQLLHDPEYQIALEEAKPLIDLANKVIKNRVAKGWTQTELARRVGTKQANISLLESGLGNPTYSFLKKIAKAFGKQLQIGLSEEEETGDLKEKYDIRYFPVFIEVIL